MHDGWTRRRVVIHLDLDCFYAQVEAKRLGIDPSTPLAVQQWSGLIAVNYPARRLGVKRHLTVAEAKRLVPELVCVHVETRGGDGRLQAEDGDEEQVPPDLHSVTLSDCPTRAFTYSAGTRIPRSPSRYVRL